MSYHGFGQFTIIGAPGVSSVNTAQPTVQTKEPSSPVPPTFKMVFTQKIEPPPQPAAPIGHRAPAALPANYSREAMGCKGKMAIPVQPGKPGYPGFLCIAMEPMQVASSFANIATGGTGSSGGGGMISIAGMATQPTAGGMNVAVPSKSEQAPGSHVTETQQPTGTVTPASFVAACKQVNGTMGTPNCCKLPNGVNMGLQGGQLVQVLQCDVAKGLAGNLPLIAGAAVIALLLARGM